MNFTEQDALDLADSLDLMPPEQQKEAYNVLNQYRTRQEAKGASAFPIAEDEERKRVQNVRNVMTVEGFEYEDYATLKNYVDSSPDKPKARAKASSALFLADQYGMDLPEVSLKHRDLKADFSFKKWGEVITDDKAFFARAKKDVEAQIAIEESVTDAYNMGIENVLMGESDALSNYESWKGKVKDRPGMTVEAFESFDAAYQETRQNLAPFADMIRKGVAGLKGNMEDGGEDPSEELVDSLIGLSPKDRALVVRALLSEAAKEGEKSEKKGTFEGLLPTVPNVKDKLKQTGESFARTLGKVYEGIDHQARDNAIDELDAEIETGIILPEKIADPKAATKAIQNAISKKTTAPEFQREIDALGMGPKDPDLQQMRAPTAEEKVLLRNALNKEVARVALERQVRQAALETDPIKNIFSEVIGGSLALMPVMALTVRNPAAGRALAPRVVGMLAARAVSLPVASKAYQAMEYEDLMTRYPSLTPKQSREIAAVSGIFMAGMDHFEWSFLKGELPSLANALSKGIANTVAKRVGVRLVEGAIFQNVQEGAQDYSTAVFHMVADSIEADMPHRRVAEDWKEWWGSRGKIALGMLPLIMLGGGVGSFKDYKGVLAQESIDQGMRLNGIVDEDRARVLDLMAEGKPEDAVTHLRESMLRRRKEVADKAIAEIKGAEAAELFTAAGQLIGAPTYRRDGDTHTVTIDGKEFQARSWGEARWMIEQKTGGILDNEIMEAYELANSLTDEGALEKADFTGGNKVADQTVEQMRERVAIQAMSMGANPTHAQSVIYSVLGESILQTKGDVLERAIKIHNGGNVLTVVEEVAETNLMKMVANKLITLQEAKAVVQNVEKITGQKFLQSDTDQGIIEAVSDMVVADTFAKRKDGTRLPAGVITRGVLAAGINRIGQTTPREGVAEPTTTFGLFLAAQRGFFKQVFLKARALRKGQKSGALGTDYRKFIDELMGMPAEQRIAGEAEVALQEDVDSLGRADASRVPVSNAPLGVVQYGGVVGTLKRDGERYVVVPKDGPEIELSGEDFVDLVFETDRAVLDQFLPSGETEQTDGRTGAPTVEKATGFTPSRDGTLSIISPEGRRLVPRKSRLADNVAQTPEGPAIKVKDTRSGRITLLRGERAQQAIEAFLSAASTMENMGRKVNYSVEARPTQQVTSEFFNDPDSFYRVIVGEDALQDILSTGTVRTNATDKIKGGMTLAEKMAARPTAFPSFSRGSASMSYAGQNENHSIVVTNDDSMQPSTSGRHSAGKTMFPTVNGVHQKSLDSNFTVYKHVGEGRYEKMFDSTSNNINYSLETRPFSDQVGNEIRQRLDVDPDLKREYFQRMMKNLSRIKDEVDDVARRDMTDKEVREMRERFTQTYLNEMMNELPEDARTEAERRRALKVAKAKAEASLKRFTQASSPEKIKAYIRTLSAVIMGLNPEDRGKVLGFKQLADIQNLDREKALKEISKRVKKMAEVVEQRIVKDLTKDIKSLLKRGAPTRESGKKPASQVSARISHLFEVAKAATKMGEEEVLKALAGLEAEINNPNSTLTEEQAQMKRDEIHIIDLAGNMEEADSAQLYALHSTLDMMFDEGFEERMTYVQKFDERAKMLTDLFKAETGIESPEALERALAKARAGKNKITQSISSLRLNWGSFNDLFYALSKWDPNSKFARAILKMERDGDNIVTDMNNELEKEIGQVYADLAGGHYAGYQLAGKLRRNTVTAINGDVLTEMQAAHAILTWEQPHGKRHMTGREGKDSWYGQYTQEWVDDLKAKISPEMHHIMTWMKDKLHERSATVNALMAERAGVMLPLGPNYFPRESESAQSSGEEHDMVEGSSFSTATITPASLRSVATNAVARPVFKDAMELFVNRERQVNHWIGKYDFVKVMQRLFLKRENTDYVRAVLGDEGVAEIKKWLKINTLGNLSQQTNWWTRQLMRASDRVSGALILGRTGSLMMQTVGAGAIATKMPLLDYLRLQFRMGQGDKSFLEAWDSDFMKRRVVQRDPALTEAVRDLSLASNPNMVKYHQRHLATLLAETDRGFMAMNYVVARRFQLERREVFSDQFGALMDNGNYDAARQLIDKRQWMTLQESEQAHEFVNAMELTDMENSQAGGSEKPTESDKWAELGNTMRNEAIGEAERIAEDVSQPVRPALKSGTEALWNSTIAKAFNPFVSDLRQKVAMLVNASANAIQDPGAAARAWSYVLLVQGLGSYMLRNGWLAARGMDKDDAFDWDNILLGMVGGIASGMPGGQALLESGSTLGGVSAAKTSAKRLLTTNPFDDPKQFFNDVDRVLSWMAILPVVGETAGAAASFSHLASDAAKVIDTAKN